MAPALWLHARPEPHHVAGLGSQFSWSGPKHVAAGDDLYNPAVSFGVLVSATQTVARIAAERGFGNPDYEWARSAAIPADVRGPAFPAQGFGTTYLEPAGARFRAAR